ncbi:MAG TPA: TIGR01777 family oxidoreductase [Micromonosporaceae bacterium]|nr:TIGR01777 family oxidoreductase [Micromonosporaceae bacterium]
MRIVMSGASGFLGHDLVRRLRGEGHRVIRLVRREPRTEDEAPWDPARGDIDPTLLSGADAVVNLSGAGVGDKRWTPAYKREIRDSRVKATTTIAAATAAARPRPTAILNASAVGWYGDTGEHAVDEDSPPGAGFFPEVCESWEAATMAAVDAGVRVTKLRTGLVLAASDGLLRPMLPLFRLGLGGRLGSGRQYMSWISLADWIGAVIFLLEREIAGPVNLTAPHPQTNADFTRELGKAVGRPAVLPVPAPALRVALGEFANEATTSQRVLPGQLTRSGYRFEHPELGPALRWALRR